MIDFMFPNPLEVVKIHVGDTPGLCEDIKMIIFSTTEG